VRNKWEESTYKCIYRSDCALQQLGEKGSRSTNHAVRADCNEYRIISTLKAKLPQALLHLSFLSFTLLMCSHWAMPVLAMPWHKHYCEPPLPFSASPLVLAILPHFCLPFAVPCISAGTRPSAVHLPATHKERFISTVTHCVQKFSSLVSSWLVTDVTDFNPQVRSILLCSLLLQLPQSQIYKWHIVSYNWTEHRTILQHQER